MGYYEEHLNAVAKRFSVKYRESGMTERQWRQLAKKTLLTYGWTEKEADRIIEKAVKKIDLQSKGERK